nr:meprin-A peptide A3 [mice, kidney, Peptide Partial, 17 aa] [Mus sp.]AAB19805.1 meprin-B peptide B2 [mice, kidney, Peptide Partial, 17 aa] [Mus sp.]
EKGLLYPKFGFQWLKFY